ncbi:VWA domain-containing protein [Halorussus gelatinilyticus]|uniref:VWA domain-containing protein n=1 Tax=Halorussus gelatinilyticus TaxID=2937524 RepID=A0A8U0IHK2_9EURY|nr:vWA domain-containing protein [Halorussus gelatinilyticus]UPW00570.1 VWA domain-containing protein [Halorussus gelatinilyticus]
MSPALPLVALPGLDASLSFTRPLALAGVPVAALVVFLLVRGGRDGGGSEGEADAADAATSAADRTASRRVRLALAATRLLVATCLVVAAAGPTTVTTATTAGDPSVTMLVDESASMGVHSPVADDLESRIEDHGVGVERVTVASGNRSRVGEGVVANLRPNASLLVVSDGRVTGGASLAEATDLARSVNATINRVRLTTNRSDSRVVVTGPRKASVGVTNRFGVRVAGVEGAPAGRPISVSIDGEAVVSRKVPKDGTFTVEHNFSSTGPHRVTARLGGEEAYAVDDTYRKTVQVVEQPRVLYVSRGNYAFEKYLRNLYDVTRAKSVPDDLSEYYAVVVHDVAAPDLGNVTALQNHVIDGGGLVTVGGPHAYGRGDYGDSRLSSLLPVEVGGETGRKSRVVLAVDVSGSAAAGMRVQKSLALNVLSQLGDRNEVGIVAFAGGAYRVAGLSSLESDRAALKKKIRSLRSGGTTNVGKGLLGASKLLGDEGGTVILLSDGRDRSKPTFSAAERLADRNVRVVSVGVGNVHEKLLRGVAERTDGTFLLANQTSRLRVRFGGANRRYSGDHAVVVDDGHFVTRGVSPTASLPGVNDVSVKRGADLLVATGDGAPALSTWRFGLGRVAAVTAYGADGSLGGLRSKPDSLLLSRTVNWAIGDPQRKATGVVAAPDTRIGEAATVVYAGESKPSNASLSFSEVAPGRYEAEAVPSALGYREVLGSAYAVNYPAEYAALGVSPELKRAVERTGGRAFAPNQPAKIAAAVKRQATRKREVRKSWDWAVLLVGLLVFVGEICARRIRRRRGNGVIP